MTSPLAEIKSDIRLAQMDYGRHARRRDPNRHQLKAHRRAGLRGSGG
jgi:hypothetical protein